jgi:hypothetical protein
MSRHSKPEGVFGEHLSFLRSFVNMTFNVEVAEKPLVLTLDDLLDMFVVEEHRVAIKWFHDNSSPGRTSLSWVHKGIIVNFRPGETNRGGFDNFNMKRLQPDFNNGEPLARIFNHIQRIIQIRNRYVAVCDALKGVNDHLKDYSQIEFYFPAARTLLMRSPRADSFVALYAKSRQHRPVGLPAAVKAAIQRASVTITQCEITGRFEPNEVQDLDDVSGFTVLLEGARIPSSEHPEQMGTNDVSHIYNRLRDKEGGPGLDMDLFDYLLVD